jgi:hypothetical protein
LNKRCENGQIILFCCSDLLYLPCSLPSVYWHCSLVEDNLIHSCFILYGLFFVHYFTAAIFTLSFCNIYVHLYSLNSCSLVKVVLIFPRFFLQPGPLWRDILLTSGHVGWLLNLYGALRQKFSFEGYWLDCPLAVSARKLIVQFCSLTGTIFPSGTVLPSYLLLIITCVWPESMSILVLYVCSSFSYY